MPEWVSTAYADYVKRLPPDWQLTLCEIPLEKRTKQTDLSRVMQKEARKMCAAIPNGSFVVALDCQGREQDSHQLANNIQRWRESHRDICFLIGGPEGFSPDCLARADYRCSLSALTLPHPFVRVLVAEQLFRSWSILNNHPYHR